MRRAPTFVVALTAAIVELVLVAAAGNQWVVDHLVKNESARELPRNHAVRAALTSFPWRWTPESHQRMIWLGEIVAVVGLVIVVFLLVFAFVGPMRAPRSFFSVFLGLWGIVVALTQIAAIGRTMLAYGDLAQGADPQGLGRFWFSVFDGPSADTVLFGGATGLIVALVAGILAATTSRRAEEGEEAGAPEATEPDEVPAWSAAIGSPQGIGSREPSGIGSGADATASWPPPDPAERVSGWPPPESPTRGGDSTSSESAPPRWPPARGNEPTDDWSRVTESNTELGRPQPPGTTGPPSGRPASGAPPGSAPPGSTSGSSAPGSAPPSPSAPGDQSRHELLLPRGPRPTPQPPRPGAPTQTGRLPLPEEGPPGS